MSALPPTPRTLGKHFTPFRSAAEEAATNRGEESWDNEGGHMSSTEGRIIRTPGCDLPYKVILTHCGRPETERSFASMREAEAFIRRNTPVPPVAHTSYDRPPEGPEDQTAERK